MDIDNPHRRGKRGLAIGRNTRRSRRGALLALAIASVAMVIPGAIAVQRPKRLGILWGFEPSQTIERRDVLANELRRLGYRAGENLEIVARGIDVRALNEPQAVRGALLQAAADLVRADVDVLWTDGTEFTTLLQNETRRIPIVTHVGDPVALGFARSLVAPGGNVTGLHGGLRTYFVKTFELMRALVPSLDEIVWLNGIFGRRYFGVFEDAARENRLLVRRIDFGDWVDAPGMEERLSRALARDVKAAHVGAGPKKLYETAGSLALRHRIALAGSPERVRVRDGGFLLGHESHWSKAELRRQAEIIVRIFRGEEPSRIPFEGPNEQRLVLNRVTAAGIGVELPPEVLLRAHEVV
jgi:putative ABC transport system substrate-binding protein